MTNGTINTPKQTCTKRIAGTTVRIMLMALLAMVMQAGLLATDVFAGDAPSTQYVDRKWVDGQVVSTTKTQNDVVWMTNGHTHLRNGWWYTRDLDPVINVPVQVDEGATANIILMDGVTLTFKKGIYVPASSTLNIYGQSAGTGKLYVHTEEVYSAGIGGTDEKDCGTINIYGGTIDAKGNTGSFGNVDSGAGIGGGNDAGAGTVRIYGGTVTAEGPDYAAGIGGGDGSSGGSVEIYGGTVNAIGGVHAAGIGSGDADAENKNGGTVIIRGGSVTAKGGADGAGIGGGEGASGANVEIWGGTVEARGGTRDSSDSGAGIGSGDKDDRSVNAGTTKIHGGTVKAYGGPDGAGIGGGNEVSGGTVVIDGGTVEATGGTWGAGIGGGESGNGGNVTISGADTRVTATGAKWGAGIGGGNKGSGDTVLIENGTVIANGGLGAAGIGGGDGGNSGNSGDVTIKGGNVTATGGDEAAGIGGGNQGNKNNTGTITISGGKVTANGGTDYGAGIGGGDEQNSGAINITDSEVNATGGKYAAGIGGGNQGSGGDITISGNKITAIAGEHGAGIGGGSNSGYCGNIKITGSEKIVASGGRLGTGIGGGYGAYKTISGSVTIEGGDIEAIAGEAAAGIGSGYSEAGTISAADGSVNTTFQGGVIKAVGGYGGGAGIGGGKHVASGRILIEGGTINATGGENGGAGIGAGSDINKSITSVDITVKGGTVTAKPGSMEESPGRYPGAAIGTGGQAFYNSGDSSHTFFNGTIDLNAGAVVAYAAESEDGGRDTSYSVIGTATDSNLSGVTGNVNFNGAHVQMYPANPAKSVRATNVSVKEDASTGLHQQVDYRTSVDSSVATALAADRVNTLTATGKYFVEVKPCEHKDAEYENKGDKHSVTCKNCSYSAEEDHIYGDPVWSWAGDYSAASAEITCKCTLALSAIATVTSEKTDGGTRKVYTAKATLGGREYTDTKTVDLPAVTVTKLPSYKDLTYTGDKQPLGTAGEVEGGTFKYALGTDATTAPGDSAYAESVPGATNAGTYYVWCKVFGDDDHRDSAAQCGTVKILKQTVADPAIPDKHYTGDTLTADVPESDIYTVSENNGGTEIGEYDVVLVLTDPDNYMWKDSDESTRTLSFHIVRADTNIVTVSMEGWSWGEEAKEPVVTATHGADTAVVTYASSEEGEYSSDKPENAGNWWVKATVPAAAGYPAGEGTAQFEIAKAAPTVTPPTPKTLTYTGKAQDLAIAGDVDGGDLYYAVTTEDTAPSDYAEAVPTATDIGIYYLWYKVEGDANHKDCEPQRMLARISADKTALADAVAAAQAYHDSIKDAGDYAPAAVKLNAVISEAEETMADPGASQQSVNDMTEALNEAVEKAKADIAKADQVRGQIRELPDADNVSVADEKDIGAARAAYESLTEDQKDLIPGATLKKLADAEKALAAAKKKAKEEDDKAKAAVVEKKIAALPAKPGAKDREAVKAARAAYNALTADQKAFVSKEMLKKLADTEYAVEAATKQVKTVTVNVKTVNAKAINKAVDKAGGSSKYVTKIVLGKKVKKISKSAFKSYKKVRILEVKTKKLKKKTVKQSLKGSKITKVKVKVGKKKVNKKYIKKYKKIFTKKNCGRKVRVR